MQLLKSDVYLVWFVLCVVLAMSCGAAEIHEAAANGEAQKIRDLLEAGEEVDAQNRRESTPLHLAARSGSLEVVQILVEEGADLDARNAWGRRPRTEAARNLHWEVVQELMPKIGDEAEKKPWIAYVDAVAEAKPDHERRVMLVFPLVKHGSDVGEIGAGGGLIALQAMWRSSFCPGRTLDTWGSLTLTAYAQQQLLGHDRRVTDDKIRDVCAIHDTENYVTGSLKVKDGRYRAVLEFNGRNGSREEIIEDRADQLHLLHCRIARLLTEYMEYSLNPTQDRLLDKPLLTSTELLHQVAKRYPAFVYFNRNDMGKFWEQLPDECSTPWTDWVQMKGMMKTLKPSWHNVEKEWEKIYSHRDNPWMGYELGLRKLAVTSSSKKIGTGSWGNGCERLAYLLEADPYNFDVLWLLARNLARMEETAVSKKLRKHLHEHLYEDSHLADYLEGKFMVERAWDARGGGWVRSVTDEGWKLFKKRLQEAKKSYENALRKEQLFWPAYTALITVGMGQSADYSTMEGYFDKSLEICPTNRTPYMRLIYAREPKWGGSVQQMFDIGRKAANTEYYKSDVPVLLFDRVINGNSFKIKEKSGPYARRQFLTSNEVWQEIEPVLEKTVKENPHNYEHAAMYMLLSYWRKDLETVTELRNRLAKADYRGNAFPDSAVGNMRWETIGQWVERCQWDDLVGATCRGDDDGLRQMIENGADPDARSHGVPAVYAAAAHGQDDCLRLLLKDGADVNASVARGKNKGWTAVHGAVSKGELSTLKMLLEHGADVTKEGAGGEHPLHNAATFERTEAIKLLVAHGADLFAEDGENQIPVSRSPGVGNLAPRRLLLKVGELQRLRLEIKKNHAGSPVEELRQAISKWRSKEDAEHQYIVIRTEGQCFLAQKPSRSSNTMFISTPELTIHSVEVRKLGPEQRLQKFAQNFSTNGESDAPQ